MVVSEPNSRELFSGDLPSFPPENVFPFRNQNIKQTRWFGDLVKSPGFCVFSGHMRH
jgi:hypothetical protein